MKRLCVVFCALVLLLTACGAVPSFETISAEEAKSLMDTETGYLILDVRTQEEFDTGHIPGAVLLPHMEAEAKASSLLPNKKQLLLIYCRSGRRSAEAAETLARLGYTNVKNFGGIIDWPYEIEETEKLLSCADGRHTWLEDCTSRTCAVCGISERITP